MMTDIEIAQSTPLCPIAEIAEKAGIPAEAAEPYGSNKAKITEDFLRQQEGRPRGKLILVTAVNPTPAGEGKTTTSIGLAQALCRLGEKAIVTLREPSLGPVFGLKGGAAGGGYSQVLPMEEINLHFTGDIHAVTAANNLLSALIDNHIHQGNALSIDPERVVFRRCMDMNDRSLRKIEIGLGGKANGTPRMDGFQISVASEVMAILCLAVDLRDLRERLGRILIGYDTAGKAVFARDLQAEGAMAALLREALRPNLVQTLEHTPCLMHGGPFANIAHGCNSVRATRLALTLADYTVTEAGFGSDLGAEKFFDIKCPAAGLEPSAAVLVVTVRALRYNGGCDKNSCREPNPQAVAAGLCNLTAHVENLRQYGVPVVVAVNRFPDDLPEELALIKAECERLGVRAAESEVFARGGAGGEALAQQVLAACREPAHFAPITTAGMTLREKIETIARRVYGAAAVEYSPEAEQQLRQMAALGLENAPVCIAKTQYSLSDDAKVLGRPAGHTLHIRGLSASCGAGFAVALAGSVLTMPGLPAHPAAMDISLTDDGKITGLFCFGGRLPGGGAGAQPRRPCGPPQRPKAAETARRAVGLRPGSCGFCGAHFGAGRLPMKILR